MMTLNSIYQYIQEKYSFYRHCRSGWQNSIRHNLSLSKAFQKVPRRTNEPGKGMKWQIVPEYRNEYLRKQERIASQSSAPSSPANKEPSSTRDNGFGPVFSSSGMHRRRSPMQRHRSPPPPPPPLPSSSPGFRSFAMPYTPNHGSRSFIGSSQRVELDETPLLSRSSKNNPDHDGSKGGSNGGSSPKPSRPLFGLAANSPPALTSSYYDDGPSSMLTPAPQRQQPRLPPPSTAQAPSRFMPMSSPAQFWKFADIAGATPARPVQETSPLKGEAVPPSSSPPPVNIASSPTKPGASQNTKLGEGEQEEATAEGKKANGASSQEQASTAAAADNNADNDDGDSGPDNDKDEGEDEGFDLARFVPMKRIYARGLVLTFFFFFWVVAKGDFNPLDHIIDN